MRFFGIVKGGKAKVFNREDMELFIASLGEGEHFMLSIDKQKRGRSIQQNAYLHLLFGILKDEFNKLGSKFTLEKVKDMCKYKFLLESEYVDGVYVGETVRHTSDLSVEEMSEFIEQIKAWAAEFSIYLPDASEQIQANI
jgi:Ser-tRNA(Ala) deacylase AlaX